MITKKQEFLQRKLKPKYEIIRKNGMKNKKISLQALKRRNDRESIDTNWRNANNPWKWKESLEMQIQMWKYLSKGLLRFFFSFIWFKVIFILRYNTQYRINILPCSFEFSIRNVEDMITKKQNLYKRKLKPK